MNRFLFLIVVSTFLFLPQVTNAQYTGGGGVGTQTNPYLIYTKAHLDELHTCLMNGYGGWSGTKHWKLMEDLVGNLDSLRTQIGNTNANFRPTNLDNIFQGTFNGNNKRIALALVNNKPDSHTGLFNTLLKAHVKNVITEGYIRNNLISTGLKEKRMGCGSIVGSNWDSRISYCQNYANFYGDWDCIGGIARKSFGGHIKYCMNAGVVIGKFAAGGIIGLCCPSTQISFCVNIGSVVCPEAGGIIGLLMEPIDDSPSIIDDFLVSDNFNAGFIRGGWPSGQLGPSNFTSQGSVGGIIGMIANSNTKTLITAIVNCINVGVIEGNNANRSGAIIGVDDTKFPIKFNVRNNYYDKQMCRYGGISNKDSMGLAEGLLTKDMIGDKLSDLLTETYWNFRPNLYPMLIDLQNEIIGIIARSPAYLDDKQVGDWDRYFDIRKCFSVNIEDEVVWRKYKVDIVDIHPNNNFYDNVELLTLGKDTLYSGRPVSEGSTIKPDPQKVVPIDVTSTANPCSFLLTLKAYPEEAASSLLGGGMKEENEVVEYEVIGNYCWTFLYWIDNASGEVRSKEFLDTVIMDKSYTFTANFIRDSFNLKLSVNPPEAGTTEGADRYNCENLAIYKVNGNECWTFLNWTDDETDEIVSTSEMDSLIMESDRAFTANFSKDLLTLTTMADPPEGAKELTGDGSYPCYDMAEYSATANECWIFTHWTDNFGKTISSDALDTIEMTSNFTLTAHFKLDSFRLTLISNPPDGAKELTGAGMYGCKYMANYTTEPNYCYVFVNWTDEDGTPISTREIDSIRMERNRTLTANFKLDALTLTLEVNPPEAGKTNGAGKYECWEIATYETIPTKCWTFVNWTNKATGNKVSEKEMDTVTMRGNLTYVANYVLDLFTLRTKADPPEGAKELTGDGKYDCGDNAPYTAKANDCWTFKHWTDSASGEILTAGSILMEKNHTLIAHFVQDSFDLVLKTNPVGAGETINAGRYACGDVVDIDVIPYDDYNFMNWRNNDGSILTDKTKHKIIMRKDSTLTAWFNTTTIIIRWDSVLNAVPGNEYSFNATIESIDNPLEFSEINFNIKMDYKLFAPTNLYTVQNGIESEIPKGNWTSSVANGLQVKIGYVELKNNQRFLRVKGTALLSSPTHTDVEFDEDKFVITTDQKYHVIFKKGYLDMTFCGSDYRGALVFMPNYSANMDNIISGDLNIEFDSEGEIAIGIEIIDFSGHVIHTDKVDLQKGNNSKQIHLNSIATGKYFVRFTNPLEQSIIQPIIIAR